MERLRAFTEMSKLQGLLMNVIAKNMSTEGIGALQDVFDALVNAGLFHIQLKSQPLLPTQFLHAHITLPWRTGWMLCGHDWLAAD